MPGQRLAFSQPIEMRMNEMISGVARRPGGQAVRRRSRRAGREGGGDRSASSTQIPGAADVSVEQVTGQPVLQIKLKQEQLARYGVPGKVVTRPGRIDRQQAAGRSGRRPAALSAGGPAAGGVSRAAPRRSARSWCPRPPASGLPLSRLADIEVVEGPVHDHPRMGPAADHRHRQRPRPRPRQLRRRGPAANRRAKSRCRRAATSIEFGGQFEHLQRAQHAADDRRAAGRRC